MDIFLILVIYLCEVYALILFLRAILSWFAISPYNPFVVFLDRITEPILAPLRRVIPRIGVIDITPMVAIILLLITASIISRI